MIYLGFLRYSHLVGQISKNFDIFCRFQVEHQRNFAILNILYKGAIKLPCNLLSLKVLFD